MNQSVITVFSPGMKSRRSIAPSGFGGAGVRGALLSKAEEPTEAVAKTRAMNNIHVSAKEIVMNEVILA